MRILPALLALCSTLGAVACSSERSGVGSADLGGRDLAGSGADFAGADLQTRSCDPCAVTGPGTFCGLDVGITPFQTGGTFGGFQSDVGTGESSDITITFSASIRWVEIKILDPDFAGNELRAYDDQNNLVTTVEFPADNMPNMLTGEFRGTGGQLIKKVVLVAAPADYVAYDNLKVIPEGCDPPIL